MRRSAGFCKHTLEVAGIAKTIAKIAKADGDLVLAGVLLHDIGKLESYRWDGWFQYTDRGHLYGHVVLGSLMLERRVRAAEPMPCTDDELDLLQHLVLSHHGQLEFGAPVQPYDPGGRGTPLCRQRQRQDRQHGRRPGESGALPGR